MPFFFFFWGIDTNAHHARRGFFLAGGRGFTFAVIGATVVPTNGLDLRMTMMAVSMPMAVMLRVSAPLPFMLVVK
jgi:hypothetical protein